MSKVKPEAPVVFWNDPIQLCGQSRLLQYENKIEYSIRSARAGGLLDQIKYNAYLKYVNSPCAGLSESSSMRHHRGIDPLFPCGRCAIHPKANLIARLWPMSWHGKIKLPASISLTCKGRDCSPMRVDREDHGRRRLSRERSRARQFFSFFSAGRGGAI